MSLKETIECVEEYAEKHGLTDTQQEEAEVIARRRYESEENPDAGPEKTARVSVKEVKEPHL